MQNDNHNFGRGIAALVALVLLYYCWPYVVGGLAVVGGVQVYLVWRHHTGRR